MAPGSTCGDTRETERQLTQMAKLELWTTSRQHSFRGLHAKPRGLVDLLPVASDGGRTRGPRQHGGVRQGHSLAHFYLPRFAKYPCIAMGQNPKPVPPVPNPTTQLGSKIVNSPTPKWDAIGFDPRPYNHDCLLLCIPHQSGY